MVERLQVDVCVIGAGSGGLSVAAGASLMGASVVLIESGPMGGDCLNFGCVPSKSLLAAAKAAAGVRGAGRFGLEVGEPVVDFQAVHDHVHGVIAAIAPHDSEARFGGLGVRVVKARARFVGPTEIAAGEVRVVARRIVVATGSSAAIPPLQGLDGVPYLTNETVFDLTACPSHLVIVGGGPIGMELAQAYRRLGAQVTVIEMQRVLPRDDPELARLVAARLRAEGVDILENTEVVEVGEGGGGVSVTVSANGVTRRVTGSHLLVAVGRRANVDDLGLDAAQVRYSAKGIDVDRRLRSSNRKVFAVGDVAGGYQFTHVASHHAEVVLRNILFRLPAKVKERGIPWVTYTDPEFAHVGLAESAARDAGAPIRILRWPFAEVDRAQAERDGDGLIKVVTTRRGRILGASIVGPHAGELIQPWVLAIERGLKIGALAGVIAPYPTYGEAGKRAAGTFYTPWLFSSWMKSLVRFLGRFG